MSQEDQSRQSMWSDFINFFHKHRNTLEGTSPNHPAPTLPGNTPVTGGNSDASTDGQDASAFNPNFRAVVADRVKAEDEKNPKIKPSTKEQKGEASEETKKAAKHK